MNLIGIVTAAAIIGIVGILIGLFLGAAGIVFKVPVNEKEEAVLAALPGNNCGGCGYPGCSGLAAAIVNGEAPVEACPVGGEAVARNVAAIMGVESGETTRMVAFIHCKGDCEKTTANFEYSGVESCSMSEFVPGGGAKSCGYGCLGFGDCIKACPFDAIYLENGIAVIDKEACKACGKCVVACPKNLISMLPYKSTQIVACRSMDPGPVTMKACKVGCIACGICVKNCPVSAITLDNFFAVIDQDICNGCGICVEKCPKKTIVTIPS